ncbi:MAG: hypothetical protein ACI9UR_001722, partial [Bacteroidia bacterium]
DFATNGTHHRWSHHLGTACKKCQIDRSLIPNRQIKESWNTLTYS